MKQGVGGCTRKQGGAALIFALLIALLLGVIAAYFAVLSKSAVTTAQTIVDRSKARHLGNRAVLEVVYALSNLGQQKFILPGEKVARPLQYRGEWQELDYDARFAVQDVAGRLSVIPFVRREWLSYLTAYGWSKKRTLAYLDKVEDWIDSDDFKRIQGMEKSGYEQLGAVVMPRNGFMQSSEELLFVEGMTAEMYESMSPFVSFWGATSRSPLYGDERMLAAYFGPENVNRIVEALTSGGQVSNMYNEIVGIDPSVVTGARSGIYRVVVESSVGTTRSELVAHVDMSGGVDLPFYIVSWQ